MHRLFYHRTGGGYNAGDENIDVESFSKNDFIVVGLFASDNKTFELTRTCGVKHSPFFTAMQETTSYTFLGMMLTALYDF